MRAVVAQKFGCYLRKSNDSPLEIGQFAADQIVQPGVAMLRPRICYVLSCLKIHNPDCKHCRAQLSSGSEIRKRLEELNAPTHSTSVAGPVGWNLIAAAVLAAETSTRGPSNPKTT